jgi:hypothetical protein
MSSMKISSRETVEPIVLHQTVRVYPLLKRWALAEETKGTYLEFIDDFEIRRIVIRSFAMGTRETRDLKNGGT